MGFADLKKQSRMGSLTEKLVKQVEKMNSGGSNKDDDRFWKPVMDKSGVGSAVIRFLPAPEGSELPWVQVWSHAFQGPGGWLIDNCLTTIGGTCPVCEKNRVLWNSGSDADKEEARKQKRKLSYYANIYVVKDPANPQNEGKVFLYKFGKKIFDKIMGAMQPEFDDDEPINPFDFWEGANFKLKLKKVAGYWNYDSSEFARPSALLEGDDDELENLYNDLHDLQAFVAPTEFKSYEDLKSVLTSPWVSKVLVVCKTRRLWKKSSSGNGNVVVTSLRALLLPPQCPLRTSMPQTSHRVLRPPMTRMRMTH